jgi:hypothetical protein
MLQECMLARSLRKISLLYATCRCTSICRDHFHGCVGRAMGEVQVQAMCIVILLMKC